MSRRAVYAAVCAVPWTHPGPDRAPGRRAQRRKQVPRTGIVASSDTRRCEGRGDVCRPAVRPECARYSPLRRWKPWRAPRCAERSPLCADLPGHRSEAPQVQQLVSSSKQIHAKTTTVIFSSLLTLVPANTLFFPLRGPSPAGSDAAWRRARRCDLLGPRSAAPGS